MAFQVSSVSSIEDVIAALVSFAVANAGFADEGTVTHPTVGGSFDGATMYRISKGGLHWKFITEASGSNSLYGRMSYTLDADFDGDQQIWSRTNFFGLSGPFVNLYMFTESGGAVHGVVEISNDIYNHFSFGSIVKTETFTGGEYISSGNYFRTDGSGNFHPVTDSYARSIFPDQDNRNGSASDGYTYVRDVQGTPNNDATDFALIGDDANLSAGKRGRMSGPFAAFWNGPYNDSPNQATLRTPMFPIYVRLLDTSNDLWRLSGYVPGARLVNMRFVDPKEIIYTDWQVFPLTQKNGDGVSAPDSGEYGIAYRRVA